MWRGEDNILVSFPSCFYMYVCPFSLHLLGHLPGTSFAMHITCHAYDLPYISPLYILHIFTVSCRCIPLVVVTAVPSYSEIGQIFQALVIITLFLTSILDNGVPE